MGEKLSKIAQKHKDSVTLPQRIKPETKESFSTKDVSSYDVETEPTHLPPPCLSDASRWLCINIRKHCKLIKSIIDVEEVVEHLYFIDDQDVRASRYIPPRDRVELLLKSIEQINKGDKWELFLEALTKSNYPYVVEIITGKTTADHADCNTILRMVCADITARAHVPILSDYFFANDVLNARDMEKIDAEQKNVGQTSACFVMLNLIPRRINNWYEILKRVLRENDMQDIANKMETYEKKLKDEPTAGNRTVTDSGHSDEQRLWAIRQELRNVVYNLQSKRRISEEEKRLLDDLMSILKEIDTTGYASLSMVSGASSHQDTRRPITLETDSSSYDQHQATSAPATSAQSFSGSFAALWEIKDRYQTISADLANSDSAFYDTSYATNGESVHL